ncbi:deoxyuridine 5'-triphosphate nucleotidohydrolase, mitochondrial isoform X1 [Hippocampus zosterae]|uniref:deoxyuridine 5'-triphosphate nucleotidohydrolase, mitochondrial isoform X1 n=1 Tax=Hippocampus zosterae TaxID=109293 RepID=UPI00223D16DF|nr:deoxyuridine 5'-triphosphate nucleotidohydrolase, mitochondrial isoform X1 [Hippocampus zosterae]
MFRGGANVKPAIFVQRAGKTHSLSCFLHCRGQGKSILLFLFFIFTVSFWRFIDFNLANMPVLEIADPCEVSPLKRRRGNPAEERSVLRFAKLSEHATTPTRGSTKAAGYDLYSAYDYSIDPMDKAVVKTDIQIAVPHGCYGRVAPRSGLAAKHFIDVGAGVVDEDYRGNVGVVLFNFGKEQFKVKKGDRVAQLVCERIVYPELVEQEKLDDTERGAGGFGSTGSN